MSLRELRATVSIPDQQTMVIGGFHNSVISNDKAVPPGLPAMPSTTQPTTPKPIGATEPFIDQLMKGPDGDQELLIFVKPTIYVVDTAPVSPPASRR